MRAAAQAEISSPSESPSVLPLAAVPCLAENSRLGFEPTEINSQQGWSEINFKTAPGMRVSLRRNGIRSRCQSLNRYAYVMNNPTSFIDPLGLDGCSGRPNDPSCIGVVSVWVPAPPRDYSNSPGWLCAATHIFCPPIPTNPQDGASSWGGGGGGGGDRCRHGLQYAVTEARKQRACSR